jgi:hypothetical protein
MKRKGIPLAVMLLVALGLPGCFFRFNMTPAPPPAAVEGVGVGANEADARREAIRDAAVKIVEQQGYRLQESNVTTTPRSDGLVQAKVKVEAKSQSLEANSAPQTAQSRSQPVR